MTGQLDGKVAIITGAASGIGRSTAELFVREGAKVVGADVQDAKGVSMETDLGASFRYIRCDVTEELQIKAAIDLAASAFGRVDVLFNNAGATGPMEPAELVTGESFDHVMRLHILAALWGIKHAVPHMKARGGSIISTSSVAALQAGWGPILYSIAKAGITQMTKVAANQLGPLGIRVNCICPGLIATPIFATSFGLGRQAADTTIEAIAEACAGAQPSKRGGRPEDIAEAALYLASDGASFVNGHALVVDGGLVTGGTAAAQQSIFGPIIKGLGIEPTLAQA
jgi:NAD(P)-dependent dehydrogenase (short-subunit alcohol dehydrogenase family)